MKWFLFASALVFQTLLDTSTPPAPAQLATPAESAAVSYALARLHEEARVGRDGVLAITNGNYHAAFSKRDGLVFTPRIDGAYEPRLTWRYRARSIDTDTTRTPLDAVEPAVSRSGDHIVDFVRPGVIERYEGERRGIEQIFVLTDHPRGSGDVRIRGEVTFTGATRTAGEGLEFSAAGAVPLAYSKPIAFDAAHRPLPVRVELHDNRLDLVLDEDALGEAAFPVTIDPLLGATNAYAVNDFDGLGHYVNVAYNWDRGEFLIVFDTVAPPTGLDREIRAKRYFDHGDAVAGSYVISEGELDIAPDVAYDLHTNTYLAVWQSNMTSGVYGRRLASDGALLGAPFFIGAGAHPAVAARNFREHTKSETSFLVAWQSSGPLAIRRVRIDAWGAILGEAQLNATALNGGASPAVAYDPIADRFLVAWQNGATRARAVSPTGGNSAETLVTSTFPATGINARTALAFDPSSKKYFLVVPGGGAYRSFFLSSAATPAVITEVMTGVAVTTSRPEHVVTAWPGGFVLTVRGTYSDETEVRAYRFRGNGEVIGSSQQDVGDMARVSAAYGQKGYLFHAHSAHNGDTYLVRVANRERWTARYVHGSGDFDGDGRSDLFLYRPEPSSFRVRTLTSTSITSPFDGIGGMPALLDWDGDGKTDLCVWSPQNGVWRIRASMSNEIETPVLGRGGDIPVPGDYFGLGRDQIAVFRPSLATWYIDSARTPTAVAVQFGEVGDLPVPADWNGDGDIELGVWRPSTGMWYAAEIDGSPVPIAFPQYGQAGDTPFAGQFVGSAIADQVLYRRSNGTFYTRNGATGFSTSVVHFYGLPVPLDWNGDGRLDHVVVDPDAGTWYIFAPSGNTAITGFGTSGDIPAGGQ
jgi:hypothetical protein